MNEIGYMPNTKFALHDVEDEGKVSHLCHHTEKLAIAFGLISTPPGTPFHIFKNLWVCRNCHSAIKLITKIVGREIILRDANCFHQFEDGLCSCRDYWMVFFPSIGSFCLQHIKFVHGKTDQC
jgi:hypothetical protein